MYRHQVGKIPVEESNVTIATASYNNNAHWLKDSQPSNFCAYYDAASLYPASGKLFIIIF